MASIYDFKPRFQNLLRPLVGRLAARGATANQVTIFSAVGSVLLGLLLLIFPNDFFLGLLPIWLFARMALNAIDGMLAREFNQKTNLGGILNELGDLISDAALYLPLAVVPPSSSVLVIILVILSMLTEAVGILKLGSQSTRRYQGPFGKSDRAFAFGLFALLLIFIDRTWLWVNLYLLLLTILAVLTIKNRSLAALRELESTNY